MTSALRHAACVVVLCCPGLLFAQEEQRFRNTIAPLLREHCESCHGAADQQAELRLDSLASINAGGRSGPVIVPGRPEESLLVAAIQRTDESLQMPPDAPLPADSIREITEWISAGAIHPDGAIASMPPGPPFDVEVARQHWAFQPLLAPPINGDSVRPAPEILDALVRAPLHAAGLRPAPPADKRTLIRRATFDLLGLPPAPNDVGSFLADTSPDAFDRVIDRLLASPAYGERWGRHWLDVVRYADSNGLDENIAYGNAWRYRNYVIDSFNADQPVNEFLIEQLAGDLLNDPSTPEPLRHRRLIATGFLSLGPKVLAEGDETRMQMDIIDEQIDTIGRSMLGLTIGCARCHDHKFDPLSQVDYYALAGIFQSTTTMESLKRIARWNEHSIATDADRANLARHQEQIESTRRAVNVALEQAVDEYRRNLVAGASTDDVTEESLPQAVRDRLSVLRASLKALEDTTPELPSAMGVADGQARHARLLARGSHLTPGRIIPRGLPVVLNPGPEFVIPENSSGRLQLAHWLASDDNALTARVFVNRVWRWHFGSGLVSSTDNFGRLGTPPENQPLLDWLARQLIEGGWSLKQLHQTILKSQTWQQSSVAENATLQADPGNRLWSRAPVRRLEAEIIRDALLSVSGLLDESQGQSMLHVKNREFLFDHTSKDGTSYDSRKRSIYLPVIRNNLYDAMSLFDCTDGTVPNGDRGTSTIASQALFMMNSQLMLDAAHALAESLLQSADLSDADRLNRLFSAALSRPPSEPERDTMLEHLERVTTQLQSATSNQVESRAAAWAAVCQSVLMSNEFVHID